MCIKEAAHPVAILVGAAAGTLAGRVVRELGIVGTPRKRSVCTGFLEAVDGVVAVRRGPGIVRSREPAE